MMIKKKSALPPEQYAREILCLLGIDSIPIPIKGICKAFDLELVYSSDLDAEGILVSKGDRHVVLIKDGIDTYETRRLFTIAHELGHYYLPLHQRGIFVCNSDDLHQYKPICQFEYEANKFASELLMPDPQFSEDVRKSDFSIEDLVRLANKYQTSLTSTAIRFSQRTKLTGAIICCQEDSIAWVAKTADSEDFEFRTGRLNERTYVHKYFDGRPIVANKFRVEPQAWLSSVDLEYGYCVYEQSLAMPRLNQTLSVVTIELDDE